MTGKKNPGDAAKHSLTGGLALVLVGHLITVWLRQAPGLLPRCLFLSFCYIAHLTLRTATLIRKPSQLYSWDLLLCRGCPLFILGPVAAFLTTAYSMEARGLNPNVLIFGYEMGWVAFQMFMEVGLVFSVAALFSPKSVSIGIPRLLWKALAAPMSLVHALYVAGSLTRGFGQAL